MNGIGQQVKAYISPLPIKVMTDKNKHIYKVPDTGFRKYMLTKWFARLSIKHINYD